MNFKEFGERVLELYGRHERDAETLQVGIKTNNGGVPTSLKADIKTIQRGADWDKNMVIIYPEMPIVTFKEVKGDIRDQATKRLNELIDAYDKLGFKYIANSRKQEWLDGYAEGVWAFTRATE
jgi:hypothetical protein